MFIIMKTQELVDVRVGESTQPDYGYELSDRCIITKSSNAVASGCLLYTSPSPRDCS